jgi:hypothetical protein
MNLTDEQWKKKQEEVHGYAKQLEKKGLDKDEIFESISEKYGTDWAADYEFTS